MAEQNPIIDAFDETLRQGGMRPDAFLSAFRAAHRDHPQLDSRATAVLVSTVLLCREAKRRGRGPARTPPALS